MKFKTWKTIKLGNGLKSGDDFRDALWRVHCHIGDSGEANAIMDRAEFSVASEETEIALVNLTAEELGLKSKYGGDIQGINFDEVCRRAEEFNLRICPEEVGPQLRIQISRSTRRMGPRSYHRNETRKTHNKGVGP